MSGQKLSKKKSGQNTPPRRSPVGPLINMYNGIGHSNNSSVPAFLESNTSHNAVLRYYQRRNEILDDSPDPNFGTAWFRLLECVRALQHIFST
jgi:hypothetical protein